MKKTKFRFSFDIRLPSRGNVFVGSFERRLESHFLEINWRKPRDDSFQPLFASVCELTPDAYSFLLVRCLEGLANRIPSVCNSSLIDEVFERLIDEKDTSFLLQTLTVDQLWEVSSLVERLISTESPLNAGLHANFDEHLEESLKRLRVLVGQT